MFDTLTEELLDLTATEKGVGLAAYAVNDDPGCSSGNCSIVICCFLCKICW